jgi:uncharacterized protein
MSRKLSSASTLQNLKREAKRWLRALRAGAPEARARLERATPQAPAEPGLRDVQLALAREHGFSGWAELARAVGEIGSRRGTDARQVAVQELLQAAGRGDVARVTALLDEHPDIIDERVPLAEGLAARTALHHGIGHVEVVRVLLGRGANPNLRDLRDPVTGEGDDALPLHFAAERGELAVVKLLVEHGADTVGAGTMHELNVLGWAVCWDSVHNLEVAEYLLAHGARHTIHTAVALGEVDVIRELTARAAADLDKPMDRTNRHRRPLHLAVVKKQPAALGTLLQLGADPEATDAAGLTPLDQAALSGEAELAQMLIERGATLRLPAAVALGRVTDIERLLRDDPDSLKPGQRYGTQLVRAAERAPGQVIRRLIEAGASVNVRDDPATAMDETTNYTPLHAAAWNSNLEAISVLLEHGADPTVRDGRYCGSPASWANYAGKLEARDLILRARVDLFQLIDFGLTDRLAAAVRREYWLLDRPFREYASCASRLGAWWPEPWHTPLWWAVAADKPEAVRVLLEQGAASLPGPDGLGLLQFAAEAGRDDIVALLEQHRQVDATPEARVRWFVKNACPDHHVRGGPAHAIAHHTAERLLRGQPELALASLETAVICGELARVERILADRPEAATEPVGPKDWEPLLYLCFTRLPAGAAATENAVAMAGLLLEHGANPNAWFMAGDSRYTPLVGVVGQGEEHRLPHPRRDELARLLLEHGAEPYDLQVLYNLHFSGRILWFLELMHEFSVKLGRQADWRDPEWRMLDMGGYGTGARYILGIAIEHDDLELAEWALSHGASPESPPPADPRYPERSLHEEALRRGRTELAELLVRHGAAPAVLRLEGEEEFVAACLRLDRARARQLAAERPEYLTSHRALFAAAEQDRADVVELLLELGVSPNVEGPGRQRALHAAAWANAVRVVELLIRRGGDIDPVEEEHDSTPLGFAVYGRREGAIELLGRHSRDIFNLTYAGKVERVRELLRTDPGLARTIRDDGASPLMWLPNDEDAAAELVRLLLAHGADPAVRTAEGLTPADYARRRGLLAAAGLLRQGS